MTVKQIAWSTALAAFALTVACTAALGAVPSLAGVVQSIQKDSKGKLVSFVLTTKGKAGKPLTVKLAVTGKTKFSLGSACATARALHARGKVSVTLTAAVKSGKATAGAVKIALPPGAKPPPKTSGG